MCGRYLTPDEAALERAWQLPAPAGYHQSWNLAPSQLAPVVLPHQDGGLSLDLLVWGFQPHWAKRAWINARAETVFTSRAFAPAAKRHRCLVPAIGWYEWQGAKAPKQAWVFHENGFRPFAFAGIFTPGGPAGPPNFGILTTDAPASLAPIHNRMPVVVDPTDFGRWIAPDCDPEEAAGIIHKHLVDFSVYKVTSYVNKPANNDAECIRPMEEGAST